MQVTFGHTVPVMRYSQVTGGVVRNARCAGLNYSCIYMYVRHADVTGVALSNTVSCITLPHDVQIPNLTCPVYYGEQTSK